MCDYANEWFVNFLVDSCADIAQGAIISTF